MTQRHAHCLDCGAPTPGEYCPQCGQKNADYREGLGDILHEVAQELFQFDSRIAHTIVPFLFQPGRLTSEWAEGKRTRYSSPLRIFLLASVAYFFALSLSPARQHVHFVVSGSQVAIHSSGTSFEFRSGDPDDAGSVDGGTVEDDTGPPDAGTNVSAPRPADEEHSGRYFDFVLSSAPKVLFALLPVFALLLKGLFRDKRRFYVEHLVFAVHVHALVFFLLLLGLWLPYASYVVTALLLVYLGAALRRFYQPSWLALAWKLFVLIIVYTIVLACALAGILIVGKRFVS